MFVYILKCSDSSYYTGVTDNVDRRFFEHNEGIVESCYTFSRRPVVLLWSQFYNDPIQAIELEKRIKGWTRKKKEALITGNFDKLVELSKNRMSHPSTSSG